MDCSGYWGYVHGHGHGHGAVLYAMIALQQSVAIHMYTVTVLVYLPRGAAHLDVLVLFASRCSKCYTMLLRGDLDILLEY